MTRRSAPNIAALALTRRDLLRDPPFCPIRPVVANWPAACTRSVTSRRACLPIGLMNRSTGPRPMVMPSKLSSTAPEPTGRICCSAPSKCSIQPTVLVTARRCVEARGAWQGIRQRCVAKVGNPGREPYALAAAAARSTRTFACLSGSLSASNAAATPSSPTVPVIIGAQFTLPSAIRCTASRYSSGE